MSLKLPTPKNPIIIFGVLGVGLLWFVGKARAQTAAISGAKAAPTSYSTPTAVAASFAQAIVALTKGLNTPNAVNAQAGAVLPASNADWTDPGLPTNFYGIPDFGWSLPKTSDVANQSVSKYGAAVDQIPAAPLYDTTADFTNNPFNAPIWTP